MLIPDELIIGKHYTACNEGCRLDPYRDTKGNPTVGFGHLIKPGDKIPTKGISLNYAWRLFEDDYELHTDEAAKLKVFNTPNAAHKIVLIDMVFQMGLGQSPTKTKKGTGVRGFKEFLRTLELDLWSEAKKHLLDSDYARIDAPNRAAINAKLIDTGRIREVPILPINGVEKAENDRMIRQAQEAFKRLLKNGLAA